jgi:hypothetical protein
MFEIGEWVKTKPMTEIHATENLYFHPDMKFECEKEVQITAKETCENRIEYTVEQNGWIWDEDWLEPITEKHIKNVSEDDITSILE